MTFGDLCLGYVICFMHPCVSCIWLIKNSSNGQVAFLCLSYSHKLVQAQVCVQCPSPLCRLSLGSLTCDWSARQPYCTVEYDGLTNKGTLVLNVVIVIVA